MRAFPKRAALAAALFSSFLLPAFAGNVPLLTGIQEPSQLLPILNGLITSINSTYNAPIATCTGTTTATCQSARILVSVTGLTTAAAGTTSAAMTVTDAAVTSASSNVLCQTQGYGGTGVPIVTNIVPGTGSVAFNVTNVAASGSLNATVVVFCNVFGP